MVASIECSLFRVGFVIPKPLSPKHRSTFLPLQHAATLILSVDWDLDYRVVSYVWDPIINQARPAQATDDGLKFRTLTVGEYRQWRANFIASLQGIVDVTEGDNLRLSNWQSRLLSTPNLPNHLVSRWNRYVRDQVHQHVQNWFREQDLSPPPDLMLNVDQRMRREITSTVALRDLILNVVREMTEAELSQLILPPQAILRAVRARRL